MNLVSLSETAKITMGQSPPSETYNKEGDGLPFFQGKADFGDLTPTIRFYCNAPKKIAKKGDILISVRAPVGPTNINPQESCIGRGLASIRAKDGTDTKYLLYFLRYFEPKLAESSRGSTFDAIGKEDLENLSIPLPPLPKQQRIAAVLDQADRLRRLRRYALKLGDTYLQSVFQEMFGDGSKFKNAKFADLLLENPKNGLYLPADKYGSGIPIIRINNFYDGVLNASETFKQVRATRKQIEEFSVSNNEILINRVNSLEYLGKCALVQGLKETTLFESNMMRIRVDTGKAYPVFLVKYLLTQQAYSQILQNAKKAVNQASVNQQDVKSLLIPLPPLPIQEKFAQVVQRYERLQSQQREVLRQAEHLFHSLLVGVFGEEGT